MIDLKEHLLNNLYKHISIDYNILENAGLYDGIEELARFLTNKIKTHQEREFKIVYNNTDIELSKFKNIFFKSIILNCERSNNYDNEAEYVLNEKIDFDKSLGIFNFVVINFELSIKHDNQDTYITLLHELTHAWDQYNAIKKSTSDLVNAYHVTHYGEIIKKLNRDEFVGKLLYFINPIEVNAFVACFAGYLYNHIKDNTINDPNKALQIIKDSDLYKNYVYMGEFINNMYNNDISIDTELIHKICKEYNTIYRKNYTETKIKKNIYNQYKKVMNKIESSIGKLCVRYVKTLKIY